MVRHLLILPVPDSLKLLYVGVTTFYVFRLQISFFFFHVPCPVSLTLAITMAKAVRSSAKRKSSPAPLMPVQSRIFLSHGCCFLPAPRRPSILPFSTSCYRRYLSPLKICSRYNVFRHFTVVKLFFRCLLFVVHSRL